MLTSLGKFLRKLRIDRNEILLDMANKLGVTVSFLSSIENGKKKMPQTWFERICTLYSFDAQQAEAFSLAIAETDETVSVNLQGASAHNRELAVSFARSFQDLSNEDIEAIKRILLGGKSE